MPIYEYKGLNAKGKQTAGVLDADSPRSLKERLRRDNVFLTEYVETRGGAETRRAGQQKAGSREVKLGQVFQRVKLLEVAEVTRQLATLIKSGIPLVDAIGAISDQLDNPLFKKIMSEVKRSVSEGSTLGAALAKHPKTFSHLYVNMVSAGEQSGSLDVVFERLAAFTEEQVRLRGKLVGALTYPVIMIILGFGIVALMMLFVIPQVQELFKRMGADLPFLTKVLIGASEFMQSWWWLLMILFIGGLVAFNSWRKSEKGKPTWDGFLLKVPVFGDLIRKVSIARFARTLSTLLASGVPILNAMTIVRSVIGNHVIAEVVEASKEAVKEGQPIAEPLRRSGQFPSMVCHMVAVGERSGQLEEMLGNIADSYEGQIESRVSSLTAVLEPMMIVIMGVGIGFMAFAIIMPMMKMSQVASHVGG
ncbi:MAG: type II secretion system inner membrane protein GspF [Myxococcales bacterium]|nr:type II secretion system inner membrane protein GspF [Myxococcales bacterium]MCB9731588.1 type II secretion system inner membrane protein GspF [Deltaproteobacteria bacterium]